MKSITDNTVQMEIISRIDKLHAGMKPLWGSMTVEQMAHHCVICEQNYLGKLVIPQTEEGKKYGQSAIKEILANDQSSFDKNADTLDVFKVREQGFDLEVEKTAWKSLISSYQTYHIASFTHWFFGEMTREQLGQFVYKHNDHHLKQFGV